MADIVKIIFESLALPELQQLANDGNVTGEE
jgi:hypothetical protein